MVPHNAIICTINVVGLYPHIPHCEGLEAPKIAINDGEVEIPSERLLNLAKLILENNYFEFDEKVYRQKLGTAIGTKFAPAFANIFMGSFENLLLETCSYRPWVWRRFLDDIFIIWLHGRERLDEFLLALNSYHESIKFTWEIGNGKISFLDVMISFNGRKFSTDVYHKPTDTHQYLNFKSCHPQHVKKAIPYSQALRLKRICDSEDVYKRREKELKGFLWKRGL